MYTALSTIGALDLLGDPLLHVATTDVVVRAGEGVEERRAAVRRKREAVAALTERYGGGREGGVGGGGEVKGEGDQAVAVGSGATAGARGSKGKRGGGEAARRAETVERSIASIADNSSFVSANKGIVDAMLLLLETHFPEGGKESGGLSLAIACGRGRYSFSKSKITYVAG